MALALYRKYRPRTFAEVIGQEHVTEPLMQALRTGRLNHAYLFSGPRGCGKTSSARILARSLNCEKGPTPEPCGVCDSCVALAPDGSGSLDVIEIDAASHGGVDDARDLRERAFFAPVASRFKVYIIDEAHMISSQGFNALLKLVEEPPEYIKFVFATTEPEKVLGTIRSRTHHYPFRLIPPGVLRPYLEQLCQREEVAVEPTVFPLIVRAGGGSARDSLSILDQLIAGAGPGGVSYPHAVALLGVTDVALIDEMCDALAAADGAAVFATIDRVAEAGHDPRRFAGDLLERLRDLIIFQQVPDAAAKGLLDVPADELGRMQDQAQRFGPATLSRMADIVHTGLTEMRGTTAPRLLLELVSARMLLPGAEDSTAALLHRMERMERRLTATGDPLPPTPTPSAGAAAPTRAPVQIRPAPTDPAAADTASATRSSPGASASRVAAASAAVSPTVAAPTEPAPTRSESAPPRPEPTAGTPAATGLGATGPGATVPVATGPGGTEPGGTESSGSEAGGTEPRGTEPRGTGPGVAGAPGSSAGERDGAEAAQSFAPAAVASGQSPAQPRPGAASTAPGAVDAAAVRRVWEEILAYVRRRSQRAAAVVREAVVRDVTGDTILLTFKHQFHADSLTNSPEVLEEAVYEVLGGRWRVVAEWLGGSDSASSPRPAGTGSGTATRATRPARRETTGRPAGVDRAQASRPTPAPAEPDDEEDWPVTAQPGGNRAAEVDLQDGAPGAATAGVPGQSSGTPRSAHSGAPTAANPAGPGGPTPATAGGQSSGSQDAGGRAVAGSGGPVAGAAVAGGFSGVGDGMPGGGRAAGGPGVGPAGTAAGAGGPGAGSAPGQRAGAGPGPRRGAGAGARGAGQSGPGGAGAARRGAGGRAGGGGTDTAWRDAPPADEPPFDPDYDRPVRDGSYEGFDPGDEPLDGAADGTTAGETSEDLALRLLTQTLGAEKIAD